VTHHRSHMAEPQRGRELHSVTLADKGWELVSRKAKRRARQ
jgi:hypothetical protein